MMRYESSVANHPAIVGRPGRDRSETLQIRENFRSRATGPRLPGPSYLAEINPTGPLELVTNFANVLVTINTTGGHVVVPQRRRVDVF